jgi:hypothetical protein
LLPPCAWIFFDDSDERRSVECVSEVLPWSAPSRTIIPGSNAEAADCGPVHDVVTGDLRSIEHFDLEGVTAPLPLPGVAAFTTDSPTGTGEVTLIFILDGSG